MSSALTVAISDEQTGTSTERDLRDWDWDEGYLELDEVYFGIFSVYGSPLGFCI